MSISKLPDDLLLDVAYQIEDPDALLNISQVWRPMRAAITRGQSTDLEAAMRLKEARMIEGPGASKFCRGRNYQEFVSKIIRYSMGWSDLQWTSQNLFPAPTYMEMPWHDGIEPIVSNFMGESGGCIYNVYSPTGLGRSELTIVRPPSERIGRQEEYFTMKISFQICAVAIDATLQEVVLLERHRPQNGDAIFHFYDFNGKELRSPYLWHANWYELIIRQFEVVDGMMGILTAQTYAPAGWSLFLDWRNPRGGLQWPHPTGDGDHWTFQFIKRDLVLISERSTHPYSGARCAHLRLVPLSGHRATQDPLNNWIQALPLAGLRRGERLIRATLVPYVGPIDGQAVDPAVPFHFDPSQRLIGIEYEYQRSWGETHHVLEICQIHSQGIQHLQSLSCAAMNQIAGNYTFIGRQLVWPVSHPRREGLYIRSVDFNTAAVPGAPRTSSQHPNSQHWVVTKDSIQNGNPGGPRVAVTTTLTSPETSYRVIFTQDNILFIVDGKRYGQEFPICAVSCNF